MQEIILKVGIIENKPTIDIEIEKGTFFWSEKKLHQGTKINFSIDEERINVTINNKLKNEHHNNYLFKSSQLEECVFKVKNVTIGIDFHWQREIDQSFIGDFEIRKNKGGGLYLINYIPMEEYLKSVISSEMSPKAPLEFLKAQAIVARSWLYSQLVKKTTGHKNFDVCSDDHCQRYQGIRYRNQENPSKAIESTRGIFLTIGKNICDARYHKSCGGITDIFETAWQDYPEPCIQSVRCFHSDNKIIKTEKDAEEWISTSPPSFCKYPGDDVLNIIFNDFDLETKDFYRWEEYLSQDEIKSLLNEKANISLGDVMDLVPLKRGPSGRISELKIICEKGSFKVSKELEIRRILSRSHLKSSAFIVKHKKNGFNLIGAGWGHGVGFCQIGGAVMALNGSDFKTILTHYFPSAKIEKLY